MPQKHILAADKYSQTVQNAFATDKLIKKFKNKKFDQFLNIFLFVQTLAFRWPTTVRLKSVRRFVRGQKAVKCL